MYVQFYVLTEAIIVINTGFICSRTTEIPESWVICGKFSNSLEEQKINIIDAHVAYIQLTSLRINLPNEIKSEYVTHYTIYSTNIYPATYYVSRESWGYISEQNGLK